MSSLLPLQKLVIEVKGTASPLFLDRAGEIASKHVGEYTEWGFASQGPMLTGVTLKNPGEKLEVTLQVGRLALVAESPAEPATLRRKADLFLRELDSRAGMAPFTRTGCRWFYVQPSDNAAKSATAVLSQFYKLTDAQSRVFGDQLLGGVVNLRFAQGPGMYRVAIYQLTQAERDDLFPLSKDALPDSSLLIDVDFYLAQTQQLSEVRAILHAAEEFVPGFVSELRSIIDWG